MWSVPSRSRLASQWDRTSSARAWFGLILVPMRACCRRPARAALDQAMACLLGQTLTGLEVVAVDDGSGDGSGERLEWWARRDGRVRVLRRPARGLVAALNEGLDACRGELVARMDADDLCHP